MPAYSRVIAQACFECRHAIRKLRFCNIRVFEALVAKYANTIKALRIARLSGRSPGFSQGDDYRWSASANGGSIETGANAQSRISLVLMPNQQTARSARGSPAEVFAAALRLGLTSFGGPIAHLGYYREEYVVRRRWLDDHAYSELVALCQLLPGPASSQVGFAIGWTRAGALGAIAAWVAFTLPSALLMFAFAIVSRGFRGPIAEAAVHGLKLAAVAVVAQAVIGMARTLTPDLPRLAMAAMAAGAMLLLHAPALQMMLIAAGAVAGLALRDASPATAWHQASHAPGKLAGLCAFALFALLLALTAAYRGTGGWLDLASIFYQAGALVFGGGHVVLPLLRGALVPDWMNDTAFLSGYGAAQALPGPLFSIAAYLGAIARSSVPAAGAALATLAIFLPGLLLVTGSLAFRRGIMGCAPARRAIAGVNAVVVGLLSAALYDPLWTTGIASYADMALAASSLLLLVLARTPPILVVGLCVAAEIALLL